MKNTPLTALHEKLGAKMVPFAGYAMPVQYAGLKEEHRAVRENVGLFDVSHMGEIDLRGPRALEAANRVLTQDLTKIEDGQACYGLLCREDGMILDDVVAYRIHAEHVLVCINAANREKDVAWVRKNCSDLADVADVSDHYAQIAVQGPSAAELISRLYGDRTASVGRFRFDRVDRGAATHIVARTGYTGEDGFEIYLPAAGAPELWEDLLESGQSLEVQPAGLGARDSLRLEMKFPLYGQDIDETTHPYEAGLGWTVKLKKDDFIGRAALAELKAKGPSRKLVGLRMMDRGIARHGYDVQKDGAKVGHVTSGTMSPSLGFAIAMAYVPADAAAVGTELEVLIRGKAAPAQVVSTPFYTPGS